MTAVLIAGGALLIVAAFVLGRRYWYAAAPCLLGIPFLVEGIGRATDAEAGGYAVVILYGVLLFAVTRLNTRYNRQRLAR